jgi:hypothetical protein
MCLLYAPCLGTVAQAPPLQQASLTRASYTEPGGWLDCQQSRKAAPRRCSATLTVRSRASAARWV